MKLNPCTTCLRPTQNGEQQPEIRPFRPFPPSPPNSTTGECGIQYSPGRVQGGRGRQRGRPRGVDRGAGSLSIIQEGKVSPPEATAKYSYLLRFTRTLHSPRSMPRIRMKRIHTHVHRTQNAKVHSKHTIFARLIRPKTCIRFLDAKRNILSIFVKY